MDQVYELPTGISTKKTYENNQKKKLAKILSLKVIIDLKFSLRKKY